MSQALPHSIVHVALVTLVLCCATAHAQDAQAPTQAPRKRQLYAYTNDRGQLVQVQTLAEVPANLRKLAREVQAPLDLADEPPGPLQLTAADIVSIGESRYENDPGAFYSFRAPDGRMVYTNMIEQVPEAQRAAGKLDLVHGAHGPHLVRQIDARLKVEHDKLLASPCCQQLRRQAQTPVGTRMLHDQAPLLICGAALLLFIVLTPWMAGKVGGGPWGRTLSMASSSLALAGILMFATMRATRAVHEFATRAAACQPNAWNAVSQSQLAAAAQAATVPSAVVAAAAPVAAPPGTLPAARASQSRDAGALRPPAATTPSAAAPPSPTDEQVAEVLRALATPPPGAPAVPDSARPADEAGLEELEQHMALMKRLQAQIEQFQQQHTGVSLEAH
jgi:hypothetical protein